MPLMPPQYTYHAPSGPKSTPPTTKLITFEHFNASSRYTWTTEDGKVSLSYDYGRSRWEVIALTRGNMELHRGTTLYNAVETAKSYGCLVYHLANVPDDVFANIDRAVSNTIIHKQSNGWNCPAHIHVSVPTYFDNKAPLTSTGELPAPNPKTLDVCEYAIPGTISKAIPALKDLELIDLTRCSSRAQEQYLAQQLDKIRARVTTAAREWPRCPKGHSDAGLTLTAVRVNELTHLAAFECETCKARKAGKKPHTKRNP